VGHLWMGLWIYFTAPVLAMQAAATVYLRRNAIVYCAKYHHYNRHRCIFNCRFPELLASESVGANADSTRVAPDRTGEGGSVPAVPTIANVQ
jgi:hypothetical protein